MTTPPSARHTDAGVTVHLPVLIVGLRWLFDTEQPSTAVWHPADATVLSTDDRIFSFTASRADGHGELTVRIADGYPDAALTQREITGFIDILDGMNEDVIDVSAAPGRTSCTLILGRFVHPSLLAAVARHHAPCGIHTEISLGRCTQCADLADRAISVADLHQQALRRRSPTTVRARAAGAPRYRLRSTRPISACRTTTSTTPTSE